MFKDFISGLIATEGINCDDAETVGENIQKSLDNVTVEEAKIPKNDQIKTLDTLQTGIVIDSETLYVDPLILFTRLAAITQRDVFLITLNMSSPQNLHLFLRADI